VGGNTPGSTVWVRVRTVGLCDEAVPAQSKAVAFGYDVDVVAEIAKRHLQVVASDVKSEVCSATIVTGKAGDAFRTRVATEMEGLPVFVLSKELLIQNKRAVGRPQDLADLKALEESE
jgi:hypothetical protein